jgi:methylmalonyl-CoA mutase N-terminal domain/subunit
MEVHQHIDQLGGVPAIRARLYMQEESRASYSYQRKVESGEKVIVGVMNLPRKELTGLPPRR